LLPQEAVHVQENAAGGDPLAGEVLDAQLALVAGNDLLVPNAVIEAVAGVADVAEAVPLAGGLGPEAV